MLNIGYSSVIKSNGSISRRQVPPNGHKVNLRGCEMTDEKGKKKKTKFCSKRIVSFLGFFCNLCFL